VDAGEEVEHRHAGGVERRLIGAPEAAAALLAVDGGAGAGKSTFAGCLASALGAAVIQLDDFVVLDDLEQFWPRFEAQVLEPLYRGEDLRYQVRDWVGDYRGHGLLAEPRCMPFCGTVVLDGVSSSRRALSARLSFSVWIDAPEPLRLERGLERDAEIADSRAIWNAWLSMEASFLAMDGARQRADLIVDGSQSHVAGHAFYILEKRW
jgi:uridine kinase